MVSFIYSIVGFLVAISVLVAVHEFGHFWVARRLGVKVLRFSIGFGKPMWSKVVGEVEYVVAAIPLGGYVKMLGEGDPEADINEDEKHRAFDNQPMWKRVAIVVAGPAINFLFAILIFWIIGMMGTQSLQPILGEVPAESLVAEAGGVKGDRIVRIDGREVDHFGQHNLYLFNRVLQRKNVSVELLTEDGRTKNLLLPVDKIPIYNIGPALMASQLGLNPVRPEISTTMRTIVANSEASRVGLEAGDTIVSIDGEETATWQQLVSVISAAPGRELELSVENEGVVRTIRATPEVYAGENGDVGRLGISPVILPHRPEQLIDIDRNPLEAIVWGVDKTWLFSSVTVRMLWKMLTLEVSPKNISGPITIADVAGQAIQISLDYYLQVLAIISISLGVMNLLPIPMLDGGHLLMYAVEFVAGKRAAENVYAVGQRVGIVLLVGLMSLAFYNDIFRLLN